MFTDAVKDAVQMTAEIAMLGDLPRRIATFGLGELGCLSASPMSSARTSRISSPVSNLLKSVFQE